MRVSPGLSRRRTLCAGVTAALLAGACGRPRQRQDRLTYLVRGESSTLDPAKAPGGRELWIMSALFEPLLQPHPQTMAPIAGLATHYHMERDATQYTFYLRGRAMPFVPLYFDTWVYLERPGIHGLNLSPIGIPAFKYAWMDTNGRRA